MIFSWLGLGLEVFGGFMGFWRVVGVVVGLGFGVVWLLWCLSY